MKAHFSDCPHHHVIVAPDCEACSGPHEFLTCGACEGTGKKPWTFAEQKRNLLILATCETCKKILACTKTGGLVGADTVPLPVGALHSSANPLL